MRFLSLLAGAGEVSLMEAVGVAEEFFLQPLRRLLAR